MFNFNLADSVAGQDLIQIGVNLGEKKGEVKLIQRLLKKKFQVVPRPITKKLKSLNGKQLILVSDRILWAESIEEVFQGIDPS